MNSVDNRTNLIVNYLPQTFSEDELYNMFVSIGAIKTCKIIRDKMTGYSYGFGFVDMATPEEAQRAIQNLNGLTIQNKKLKVALARPPGEDTKGANLYVSNIPTHYREEEVRSLFSSFGNIVQVRVLSDPITGNSKGVGFVLFESKSNAEHALRVMNGTVPEEGSQALNVKFADDNAKKVRPPSQPEYGGYSQGPPMRQGGPMRGPSGNRSRYNPMSAGGYSGGGGGGGYQGNYGTPRGRGPNMANAMGDSNAGGQFNQPQGVTLFVYNIGSDATKQEVYSLFAPYGMVMKVDVIWDNNKNQCKGFGFVTMSNISEANYAIEYLNGFMYKGANLQVSLKSGKQ